MRTTLTLLVATAVAAPLLAAPLLAALLMAGCKGEATDTTSAAPSTTTTTAQGPGATVAGSGAAIAWKTDFEAALETAKAEGKPVMVDFYADWCHWCTKLDEETYSDAQVQALAESFISVKVDADAEQALAAAHGASGLPTIVFFSPEGEETHRISGYLPADEFLTEMKAALGS